jgi:hypothetical protein
MRTYANGRDTDAILRERRIEGTRRSTPPCSGVWRVPRSMDRTGSRNLVDNVSVMPSAEVSKSALG